MDLPRPAPMPNPPPFAGPELEGARRPLLALARSLGSDPELAEELAQATLATAVERRAVFDARRELRPWLCGILVRLHARTRRRVHVGLDSLAGREPIASVASDPVRAAEYAELEDALSSALASSSATDRAVLEGWLAGAVDLAPGATRVRLHRARRRLRERLPRGLATLAAFLGLGSRRARAETHAGATMFAGAAVVALALAACWIGWAASRNGAPGELGWNPAGVRLEAGALAGAGTMHLAPRFEVLPESEERPRLAAPSPFRTFRTFRTITARAEDARVPPGTVLLPGGETILGTTREAIQALIEETPGADKYVRALDAETPQHTRALAPFFLGATEVTNEQYAVFVRATGHRPPQHWGTAAVDAASREFLVARGEANLVRRREGKPLLDTRFDRERWWDENWSTAEWAVPDGEALQPVVYVDFADVGAYCRWAGVRPATEFEFQHAARGATDRPYPWGAEWQDGRFCASSEDRVHTRARLVGTFPEGRSPEGVWDLSGNVWEWTSSPYSPYPHFEANTYELDSEHERMPQPYWDGKKLVVVGGCYQTSRVVARCTVRRPTERDERTNALGFRIAASTTPARDLAAAAADDWDTLDLAPDAVVGVDRWTARPTRPGGSEDSGDPDGYAVITGYRVLALVPPASADGGGLLLTSEPLAEPRLDPGAYVVEPLEAELVFRDRAGLERARIAASSPRPGAPSVEFWTQVATDGSERDGLSLTAGGLRVDLVPRTPLHDWRR